MTLVKNNPGNPKIFTDRISSESFFDTDGIGARLLVLRVIGKPETAGSKKGFVNPKNGRVIITDDNKKGKPWMAAVAESGQRAMENAGLVELLNGPLAVAFHFYFPRPAGHFGTGRNAGVLKASAPIYKATIPDVLKLARAVEDALTGVVWRDDARIVREFLSKDFGHPPGVRISIHRMEE